MSGRNKVYLALDIVIALAFVLALLTGLVWLIPRLSDGQNGQMVVLGLASRTWRDLHTWFSLVMIAGVLVHVALHWNWIVQMTKRLRQGKARKARLNYTLDVVLGLAFLAAALTGLAFLLLGQGGFQGGRNPSFQTALLGLSRGTWSDLHTWFSLVLVTAIFVHQVPHWNWISRTVGRLFRRDEGAVRPRQVVRVDER